MTKKYGFSLLFFTAITLTTALSTTEVQASTLGSTADKPPCRIELDNAHISTTAYEKHNVAVVIVKARSICNQYQSEVSLSVEIYKVEHFGNKIVTESVTSPNDPKSSGFIITSKNTTKVCISGAKTKYYGIAYAKALINGKWQFAGRTQSPKITELACGTLG